MFINNFYIKIFYWKCKFNFYLYI